MLCARSFIDPYDAAKEQVDLPVPLEDISPGPGSVQIN